MNKEHRSPIFLFAVYFFIFLFLYTAADKVMNHETFENVLSRSVLIGPVSSFVSWLVPASEILIGIVNTVTDFTARPAMAGKAMIRHTITGTEGTTLVFDNCIDAGAEAAECKDGSVVEI